MQFSAPVLYGTTVLIWGSTWFAITFQLGTVAPSWSVAWRFAVAAGLLLLWRRLGRARVPPAWRDHLRMAMQGALLFSLNYYLFYLAIGHITSGLTAVVFSLIQVMNTGFAALFFRHPIRRRVVLGGAIGIAGLVLIFWPEVTRAEPGGSASLGIALSLAATALASLGNMAALANQRRGLAVGESNTFGMAYGAVLMAVIAGLDALLFGGPAPSFEWSGAYVFSLLYLALFGSVAAFWAYLTLLGRIGPDRAAYTTILFPVVALALSTVFEDYVWSAAAFGGVALVILGNLIVMTRLGPTRLAEKHPAEKHT